MQRRRTSPLIRTATAIAAATSALLLGTGIAGAIPMPAPNTSAAVVTSSSVLEDAEGNGCAITGELPKVGEYPAFLPSIPPVVPPPGPSWVHISM